MNTRNSIAWSIAPALLLLATSPLTAAVLFEHPFTSFGDESPWCSSCNGDYRVWDQFELASVSKISTIEARLWFDLTPNISANAIEYSIWDVTRTTQLFAQTCVVSDLEITQVDSYVYDVGADIADVTFAAGSYTLSIYAGSFSDNMGWWASSPTVHGKSFQSFGGSGNGLDMAFRILGVPEPSGLALALLGVVTFVSQRQRALPS